LVCTNLNTVLEIRNPIVQWTPLSILPQITSGTLQRRKMLFFSLFYVFLFLNFFLLLLLLLLLKRTNFSNRFQFLFHRIKNLSRSTKFPFFCLLILLWFGLRFTPLFLFNVWLNFVIISYSYLKHAVWIVRSHFPHLHCFCRMLTIKESTHVTKNQPMPIFINTLITFLYFPLYPSLVFTHLSRCI